MFKTKVLQLFRKAFGPWVEAAPPRRRKPRPSIRPMLEVLEDRIVPSTVTVSNTNDAGAGSLRAAITQVNQSNDASNTIVFANNVTGSITLESALQAINKNVAITGPGASELTIGRDPQAKTQFGIFAINAKQTVSITGLSIAGGTGVSGVSKGDGGGVYNLGKLTLTNDTLEFNNAKFGAGIYNDLTGSVTLSGVELWNNTASNNGGGIYNAGTCSISNGSTIFDNSSGGSGGGVYNSSSLTISQSAIYANEALFDGGGIEDRGTLVWNGGTLQSNEAQNDGGGLDVTNKGTANLTNVQITNQNTATNKGGGFFIWSGSVTLNGCTLSGNQAKVGTGGAYINGAGTVTKNGGNIVDAIVPVNQG